MRKPSSAAPRMPPTTPPTMAPVWLEEASEVEGMVTEAEEDTAVTSVDVKYGANCSGGMVRTTAVDVVSRTVVGTFVIHVLAKVSVGNDSFCV